MGIEGNVPFTFHKERSMSATPTITTSRTANVALVNEAYAAFSVGDIPRLISMLTDDVSWRTPRTLPQGGDFLGHAGAMAFFQAIGANWSSLVVDVEAVDAVSDTLVAGVARGNGTRSDGAAASYGVVHVFTVRDGKIAAFREYADLDAAM